MLKILSASNIDKLQEDANAYEVSQIGSLTISNGHYFLCFLGELKIPIVVPIVVPEVVAAEPKPVAKRRKKPITK
jgi:hypothetical protein